MKLNVTNHNKESRNFQLGIPLFKRWNFSTVLIILPPTPFPTVPRVCACVDLITTKPTNPGENFPLLIIGEQHHTWKFNGAKVITTDSVFCFHRRHTWTVTLAHAKQYTWCPSKINHGSKCVIRLKSYKIHVLTGWRAPAFSRCFFV